MATRRQHYVWKHHLNEWRNDRGQIVCMTHDNGKIFSTNPYNIMLKRDFYKLSHITERDAQFLEAGLIAASPSPIRDLVRVMIWTLAVPADVEERMKHTPGVPDTVKENIRAMTIEFQENLHQDIEAKSVPIIQQIRQKNFEFLRAYETSIPFFQFIGHQYLRTKKMHDRTSEYLSRVVDGEDFSHLKNIYCYCYANIIGFMLQVFKDKLEFILLDNTSDLGFITGDQPVVNLFMESGVYPPRNFVAYYPLSPKSALLLSFRGYDMNPIRLDECLIKKFNDLIAFQSEYAIVSDSDSVLKSIRDDWPSTPPSFHHLFENLASDFGTSGDVA